MIGQMAIAIALPGFNGLGRLVTPIFLSGNGFYLQLEPLRGTYRGPVGHGIAYSRLLLHLFRA